MQATYHIKGKEVNDNFINIIRKLFRDDEDITITIASGEERSAGKALIKKLSDLEEKYPPKQVDKNFDFNAAVDAGINL
jgi:predicted RNA-binding protein with RPS1 domain